MALVIGSRWSWFLDDPLGIGWDTWVKQVQPNHTKQTSDLNYVAVVKAVGWSLENENQPMNCCVVTYPFTFVLGPWEARSIRIDEFWRAWRAHKGFQASFLVISDLAVLLLFLILILFLFVLLQSQLFFGYLSSFLRLFLPCKECQTFHGVPRMTAVSKGLCSYHLN